MYVLVSITRHNKNGVGVEAANVNITPFLVFFKMYTICGTVISKYKIPRLK